MKDFMESISPTLKSNVCRYIFFVAINSNPLLAKILKNTDHMRTLGGIKFKKK